MAALKHQQEEINYEMTLDNFYDFNIDKTIIDTWSPENINAKSEAEASHCSTHYFNMNEGDVKLADNVKWNEVKTSESTTKQGGDLKDGAQVKLELVNEDDIILLRKVVMEKIIANGKADLACMKLFKQSKNVFEKTIVTCDTDQIKVDNMFTVLPKLVTEIESFIEDMENVMANWSDDSILSPTYERILPHLAKFYQYSCSTSTVLKMLESSGGNNSRQMSLEKVMPKLQSSFADLVHCPIVAQSRIYYGLKELSKYTPSENMDCRELLEIRMHMRRHASFGFLNNEKLQLVKSGYVVEEVKNKRKLRFLFLFPKNLIITKLKVKANNVVYDKKAIIRLGPCMVNLEESTDELDAELKNDIESIKKSIKKCQTRIEKMEMPADKCCDINRWKSDCSRRRLHKLEASLVLLVPRKRLTLITTVDKKFYNFLFFSRVDFETWKDLIEWHDYTNTDIAAYMNCIKNYSVIPRLTSLSSSNNPLYHEGSIDVYVHQLKGYVLESDAFLSLEVDCFGGYFTKVITTHIIEKGRNPIFNQKFELPLSCSQTLRISSYKCDEEEPHEFKPFSTGILENAQLCLSLRLSPHTVNETRSCSYHFATDELQRVCRMRGKIFGECMKKVLKREERKVPLIITSCVEEIERRGLDMSFIYAMRGDETRVNDLISIFDICSFTGSHYIKQKRYTPYDITEVLTRYLRALPYSILLCPNNYLAVFDIEDIAVKVRMISFLLTNIPEPGCSVFSYLLDHMTRICKNECNNRVSPGILGGIFSSVILDSDVSLTLEEYIRKRNHFAGILKCMIELKIEGYNLDNADS